MSLAKRRIPLQGIAPQSVHEVSTTVSTRVSTRSPSPRLTDSQIGAAKANGKQQDFTDPACRGLVLRISPTGSKSWLFRYKWNRLPVRISLGQYPSLSLADARAQALKHQEHLDKAIDPRQTERSTGKIQLNIPRPKPGPKRQTATKPVPVPNGPLNAQPAPATPAESRSAIAAPDPSDARSVQRLAHEFVEHYILPRREKPAEVIRILNKDVLPKWRHRDARSISHREVIELLDEIVHRGAPVIANRTADILGLLFKYGVHRGIVENSPVRLLYAPGGKEQPRTRVLNEGELAAFVQGIEAVCKGSNRSHVHMLLLLTLQRRSTLALAEWKEIDFENRIWRIPSEHDKMRRAHEIPLTDWTITKFKALKDLSKGSAYVLPNRNGEKAASPELISRSIHRLESRFAAIGIADFTAHDLRRTGRTFLAKLGVTTEIAERLLNHAKMQIEGTYNLYDYFDEKRDALKRWEGYLADLAKRPLPEPHPRAVVESLQRSKLTARNRQSDSLSPFDRLNQRETSEKNYDGGKN